MSSQNRNEVETVKKELLKAGIAAEMRLNPVAEALGVSGVELWVQNERDFFEASKLYAHLQGHPSAVGWEAMVSGPQAHLAGKVEHAKTKSQGFESVAQPKNGSKMEGKPALHPGLDLKEASSLLQKSIEEVCLRESELAGECTSLHAKIEELTTALAQAQAEVARETQRREAAQHHQSEQVRGLLNTLEREREEFQGQLKSRDELLKKTQVKVDSLSRLLQSQQAANTAQKKELGSLELQREQQEQCLAEVRKEVAAEKEARIAAEQRAGFAEECLQAQWVDRQELERQIEAHVASLGSLLRKANSKTTAEGGK